jgi:hypothetical protein
MASYDVASTICQAQLVGLVLFFTFLFAIAGQQLFQARDVAENQHSTDVESTDRVRAYAYS